MRESLCPLERPCFAGNRCGMSFLVTRLPSSCPASLYPRAPPSHQWRDGAACSQSLHWSDGGAAGPAPTGPSAWCHLMSAAEKWPVVASQSRLPGHLWATGAAQGTPMGRAVGGALSPPGAEVLAGSTSSTQATGRWGAGAVGLSALRGGPAPPFPRGPSRGHKDTSTRPAAGPEVPRRNPPGGAVLV